MNIRVVNDWESTEINGQQYGLYTAYIKNAPRLKGSGVDITSAIGQLIKNHQRRLGVRVKLNNEVWRVNDPELNGDNKSQRKQNGENIIGNHKRPRAEVKYNVVVNVAGDKATAQFDGGDLYSQSTSLQAVGELFLKTVSVEGWVIEQWKLKSKE